MPFILPLLPAILAGVGAVGGVVEGAQAGGRQQKALTQQEQIAQQEMQDKQAIFDKLVPFFSSYLSSGSPFLSNIQRAGAESTATQANNAAGQIRSTMGSSGLGFGPSGTTAAAIAGLGAETGKTASSNYLTNLLNNELLKFQAAQGLNTVGQTAGSPQNQPNVSTQLPYQSLGSGLSGLSQILASLGQNPNTNQVPGSAPGSSTIGINSGAIPGIGPGGVPTPVPQIPFPTSTAPTTQGWAMGPD